MTDAKQDFAFLPLGGTGEIGMNLNLYRCDGQWLAVDCGIGFGGPDLPEVELMVPDPCFIVERRDKLRGLVITHAHEDHIGAVAWLWPRLRCPVYATPFAAAVLRRKLTEAQLVNEVPLHILACGAAFDLDPFQLQFIPVTHSVIESQALVIRTRHGTVLHTGDWKLDPEPLIGPPTDEAALRRLGDDGVLAMVCDSTNAMVEGRSASEGDVRRNLVRMLKDVRGRVAVTCFASNVARVESIALAARESGRDVALVGRSLRNLETAARDCGYLRQVPEFIPEADAGSVPDDRLVMIVTGSQGEARSALARIAADTHPNVALGEGDTVVFSSRTIPGNERAVGLVQDSLTRRGVRLVLDEEYGVHASGHPARDELRRLYELVRPQYLVPVHGEWRHLQAQAELARGAQIRPLSLEDGDVLTLAPGVPDITDSVPVGRLAVDGPRLVPLSGGIMAVRRRALHNGIVIGSIVLDRQGNLRGRPVISAPGLFEEADPELARIADQFDANLDHNGPDGDNTAFLEQARTALRRALGRRWQKRPMVDVHVLRID